MGVINFDNFDSINSNTLYKREGDDISNRTIVIIALLVIIIAIITYIICRFSKKNKQRRYKMFTRNKHGHAINITPDKATVTMTMDHEENIDESSNISSNKSDSNMVPEKTNNSKTSEVPLSSDPIAIITLPSASVATATSPSPSGPTTNKNESK